MEPLVFTFLGYKARILHPEYLFLALAVAGTGLGLLLAWRRRVRRVLATVPERLIGRVAPGWSPGRQGGRLSITLAALVVLSLALTQPQCGTGTELAKKMGIDVVVALDVSKSMLARDIRPSRLERARLELTELIDRLRGDRFGLVVFAGSAFVQCPLTTDYAAAKLFLRAVDPDAMPRQGTDLGLALGTAQDLLTTRKGSRARVIVLLTDGEDHAGHLGEVAKKLAADGIRVFAVGIGSDLGEPIPVVDAHGNVTGYKKDPAGNTVLSRLDAASLEALARDTDGVFVQASAGGAGIAEVVEQIERLEKAEFESRITTRFEDRSALLIYPGFLLLLLGTALRPSRMRRREPVVPPAKGRGRPAAGDGRGGDTGRPGARALSLLLLLASPVLTGAGLLESEHPQVQGGNEAYGAGRYDEALERYDAALETDLEPGQRAAVHFNRGTTLAAKGDVDGAQEAFQSALAGREGALKAKDYYNLGTAFLGAEKPEQAIEALQRSLRLDPGNRAAKYNLELALRAIQRQQEQQKDPQKQSQEGREQEQQDQQAGRQDQQEQQAADEGREDEEGEPQEQASDNAGQQGDEDQPQDQGRKEPGDDAQRADSGQQAEEGGDEKRDEGRDEGGDEEAEREEQARADEESREGGDEGQGERPKPEPGEEDGREAELAGDAARPDPGEEDQPGTAQDSHALGQPTPVGEQEAEKILEAMSRGEKPLQMQLFMMKKDRTDRTTEEKDW